MTYITLDEAIQDLGKGEVLSLVNSQLKTRLAGKRWRDGQKELINLGRQTLNLQKVKPVLVGKVS